MDWTRGLPEEVRDAADGELLAAAGCGATLGDLAQIAEDLHRQHARPDTDNPRGFEDRRLRLVKTFDGAARLDGDLDPRCAAATETVLGALSQPRGPEDDRTHAQRLHDAQEEAMMRLLAADGLLPQRAGQPVRLELDITLNQLANLGEGSPAGPGSVCDSVIQPIITGLLDPGLLTHLTDTSQPDTGTSDSHPQPDTQEQPGAQAAAASQGNPQPGAPAQPLTQPDAPGATGQPDAPAGPGDHDRQGEFTGPGHPGDDPQPEPDAHRAAGDHGPPAAHTGAATPHWRDLLQQAATTATGQPPPTDVLAQAIALLSGPSGRAAWLRRRATGIPAATISLPLDIAAASEPPPPSAPTAPRPCTATHRPTRPEHMSHHDSAADQRGRLRRALAFTAVCGPAAGHARRTTSRP
jgi:hypothetical protein